MSSILQGVFGTTVQKRQLVALFVILASLRSAPSSAAPNAYEILFSGTFDFCVTCEGTVLQSLNNTPFSGRILIPADVKNGDANLPLIEYELTTAYGPFNFSVPNETEVDIDDNLSYGFGSPLPPFDFLAVKGYNDAPFTFQLLFHKYGSSDEVPDMIVDDVIAGVNALKNADSIQFAIIEADIGQPSQAAAGSVDVAVNITELEIRLPPRAIPIPWQWLGLLVLIILGLALNKRKAA